MTTTQGDAAELEGWRRLIALGALVPPLVVLVPLVVVDRAFALALVVALLAVPLLAPTVLARRLATFRRTALASAAIYGLGGMVFALVGGLVAVASASVLLAAVVLPPRGARASIWIPSVVAAIALHVWAVLLVEVTLTG